MNSGTILFNGERLFGGGQHLVLAMSWRRESVERGFAGLDGVLSIDLGMRGRTLKQRGRLSAGSVVAMAELTDDISSYIDGQAYTLVDQNGISYGNVRMDSFKLSGPIAVGNQASCEYEIVYTQLRK